jgi:hypothetical protein
MLALTPPTGIRERQRLRSGTVQTYSNVLPVNFGDPYFGSTETEPLELL